MSDSDITRSEAVSVAVIFVSTRSFASIPASIV
jgi:hypothetical protein